MPIGEGGEVHREGVLGCVDGGLMANQKVVINVMGGYACIVS